MRNIQVTVRSEDSLQLCYRRYVLSIFFFLVVAALAVLLLSALFKIPKPTLNLPHLPLMSQHQTRFVAEDLNKTPTLLFFGFTQSHTA
jgi:cytochrome oxidase Cu insertion factor (SCO1/SenC/PrrC family)